MLKYKGNLAVAAAVFLIVFTVNGMAAEAQQPQVIDRVAVIDVVDGHVLRDHRVMIRDRTIEAVGPVGKVDMPDDAMVIDGRGKYLIPGLFDAHVHLTADIDNFPPLLVAHGVVCVRDTGAPTDVILGLKRQAAETQRPCPDIIATGAIIDGDPPIWPFSEACTTAEEARAAVRKLAAAGVDQIKVYSMLPAEAYFAAVEQATELGLKVTGHVPLALSLEDAVESGHACIEHLDGFAKFLTGIADGDVAPDAGLPQQLAGWTLWEDVDRDRLRQQIRAQAERNIVHCPTLVVMQGIARVTDVERPGVDDERMKYVSPASRAFWNRPGYESFSRFAAQHVAAMQQLVGMLHEEGVTLIIGTDLANPYVFAGWAVHEEMQLFEQAGIPAADVLRLATITPARFMGVGDRLGSIEAGKTASLVLLEANPLEQIANTQKIEAVWLRGRHFDRSALDQLLSEAAQTVAGDEAAAAETAPEMPGEVLFRGRFKVKFMQFDAGEEEFSISRNGDGWHIWAHMKTSGGGQQPIVVTYHVDSEFNFVEATWRQLSAQPVSATYRIEDGQLVAHGERGEEQFDPVSLELSERYWVVPPIAAADFVFYAAALAGDDQTQSARLPPLVAGQSIEYQAISFGYPGWQPVSNAGQMTRHEDRPLPSTEEQGAEEQGAEEQGEEADTNYAHFSGLMQTPIGEIKSQAWATATGLPVHTVANMPFGQVEITLELDAPPKEE